jgi:predicted transcriptional regulator
MANDRNKFRTWVKTRLIENDLTVSELAKRVGYPRRTVSAAIHGASFPYVVTSIAKLLNHDSKTDVPLPSSPARPERRIRISTK